MYLLKLLGMAGLADEQERELDSVLRKPKHAALLAYLAMPNPGTWHRRDSIVATLWPDNDPHRARAALRSALLVLRRHLPEGAIVSRGDDEVCLSTQIITTDVAAMAADVAAGRLESALDRYQGDFLAGLFLREAPEFESWLERERARARDLAIHAASRLSQEREQAGDLPGAIDAARQAAQWSPEDETLVRRWIGLLDHGGDRAQAFAVYDRFRTDLANSLGVRPAVETVALMDAIRTRSEPTGAVKRAPSSATRSEPRTDPGGSARTVNPRRRLALAAIALVTGAVAIAVLPDRNGSSAVSIRSIVVLPTIDETGDSSIAWLASGLAEGIGRRLDGLGGIQVFSGARATWRADSREQRAIVAREYHSTDLLRTRIRKANDSLELLVSLIDTTSDEERSIGSYLFSALGVRDVEDAAAADVAGRLFRIAMPTFPKHADSDIDNRSYALMLQGWHEVFVSERPAPGELRNRYINAKKLFDSALTLDPRNARAYSGLSTVWGVQAVTDLVSFSEGYELSVAAAEKALALDSMQAGAWGNLAIMRAHKSGDLSIGLELIAKAEVAEPSNPEIFVIKASMLKAAHRFHESAFADRLARRLDPMNPNMRMLVGHSELCAGRGEDAVRLYQPEVELNPADRRTREGLTRAMAMAGRYDDAIVSLRAEATVARDTVLLRWLSTARGKSGYWATRHAMGRRRIATLARQEGRVAPLRIVQASFAAGDEDAAYRAIDQALAAGTPALYRLPCMPDIDEFRDTPRFKRALEKIGKLTVRGSTALTLR